MIELLESMVAGTLWTGVFVLLVLAVQRRPEAPIGLAVLAAYPVFFALQIVLANALGAAGQLTTGGVRAAYAVAAVLGVFLLFRSRQAGARPDAAAAPQHVESARPLVEPAPAPHVDGLGREAVRIRRIVIGAATFTLAGLALFTLISPVHVWDVLAYHMPMVASYIQNGSLDAWPTQDLRQIYRVNAGELQMLSIALLARSDAWVELPNVLGLAVVLTASFEIARLAFRRAAFPYVVILLVITAPQIVIGAATAKNDLVFTAVLLCAFYWIVRAGLSTGPRTWLYVVLAALSAAIAGATKVMGLNVVGAVGLLALVLSVRRRLAWRHVFLYGGTAITALLVLAGHIYFGNLDRSAMPVGVAPGEIHYSFGLINVIEAIDYYVFDLTLGRLVRRPIFEHDFMHYGYLFPFMLGLGIAAAFRQLRDRRFVPACLALLAVALFLSVIAVRRPIGWDQRFMIWLVPTFAILALSLIERLSARRVVALTMVAAVLVAGNVAIMFAFESDGLFRRAVRHLVSTGQVARFIDVPNRRYPHMSSGLAALDRAATARDSILYIGTDDSWMYPLWDRRFTRHVEGVRDEDHADARIATRHFRFIVVETEARPKIPAVARARAALSGYIVLADTRDRTIFVRDDTVAVPPPPSASGT